MDSMAIIAAAVASLTAGGAGAQEQTNPSWSRPVSPDLASRLYPGFAALLGEDGRVTVRCQIEGDGHPYLCEVIDEMPRGLGFGAAARVVIASGELRAARVDEEVVSRTIQTSVNFKMKAGALPFGGWTGPEPSPATQNLAKEIIAEWAAAGRMPPLYRDQMLDGLDFDRRVVVEPWIEELFPSDAARDKETLALQLARLFDEDSLRRLRAGDRVEWPSEEEFYAACPEPSPAELAAMSELRRRYCDLYECAGD